MASRTNGLKDQVLLMKTIQTWKESDSNNMCPHDHEALSELIPSYFLEQIPQAPIGAMALIV
eukprot:1553278-Amphidinium_carterae.1